MSLKNFIEGGQEFGGMWEDRMHPPGAQQETIGGDKETLEQYLMVGVLSLENSEAEKAPQKKKKKPGRGGGGPEPALALEDKRRRGH